MLLAPGTMACSLQQVIDGRCQLWAACTGLWMDEHPRDPLSPPGTSRGSQKITPYPPSSAAGTAGKHAGTGSMPPCLPTAKTRESRIRGLGRTERSKKSFIKGIYFCMAPCVARRVLPQESCAPGAARIPVLGSAFCLA